jgi:uncharacterized membrane protein
MTLIGHLHPLLVHFPIALVIVASVAEAAATVSKDSRWRILAIGNLRAGAAFALIAVGAGWYLASGIWSDAAPLLEWHGWLGTIAAFVTLAAAFAAPGARTQSARNLTTYRAGLLVAGVVMAVAAHLGATLVWGAEFLHP